MAECVFIMDSLDRNVTASSETATFVSRRHPSLAPFPGQGEARALLNGSCRLLIAPMLRPYHPKALHPE